MIELGITGDNEKFKVYLNKCADGEQYGLLNCMKYHNCFKCLHFNLSGDFEYEVDFAKNHNIQHTEIRAFIKRNLENGTYKYIVLSKKAIEESEKIWKEHMEYAKRN